MSDQRCLICKYLGDHAHKTLSKDKIFRERGTDLVVPLCYTHSWELFRSGQRSFLAKYRHNFMQFYGTETESELIDFIKGTGAKGFDRWAA
ncbi:MAG: hypothetical protein ACLGG7_11125 [Bacteriovoracia bacterium]